MSYRALSRPHEFLDPTIVLMLAVLSSCKPGSVSSSPEIDPPCAAGLVREGGVCIDIDECEAEQAPCDTTAICVNQFGSFTCTCLTGFAGDGTTCADVDECATGTHQCNANAICTNYVGGYNCGCGLGFSGSSVRCGVSKTL